MVDLRVEGPAVERGEGIRTPETPALVADRTAEVCDGGRRDEFPDFRTLPAFDLVDG